MYYQCYNPCGIRDWIGCATAPSSREKRKKRDTLAISSLAVDQKPWQCYSMQWEMLMKGALIHYHWGLLNWKEAYKCHEFLSALSNPSEYTSLSHLAHMPENPQIIQSSFSCDAGFHHLQRICSAAARRKQVQEACQPFCSNRTQLGADLECSSLQGILLPKQTSPCLVSHGSFLYRAALLAGTQFRLCLWFMNNIPIASATFPVLCLVLGVFGKLGLIYWEDAVSVVHVGVLTSPFLYHLVFIPNRIHMILSSWQTVETRRHHQ